MSSAKCTDIKKARLVCLCVGVERGWSCLSHAKSTSSFQLSGLTNAKGTRIQTFQLDSLLI